MLKIHDLFLRYYKYYLYYNINYEYNSNMEKIRKIIIN